MHITIGIFGSTELVKKLAKAGTINDIAIYNHASSEGVLTFAQPNSDKLQSLLQTLGMIDFPIVVFSQMTKEFGEQLVAVDAAGFDYGLIVSDGVPNEQIKQAIKGSTLEKFEIIGNDTVEIRQKILGAKLVRNFDDQPWLPIDNYFDVKGVGTVMLSIVKQGKLKKYDTLRVEPLGKEVLVKGMQSQDNDITEAEAGMRLGVNTKGVETSDLKRGFVICKNASVAREISVEFSKSRYSKEEIAKGGQLFVASGLQVIAASVLDVSEKVAKLKLEQPIVHLSGQRCILGSTKQTLPRILGNGSIR